MPMQMHVKARGGHMVSSSIALEFIALRQNLPLS